MPQPHFGKLFDAFDIDRAAIAARFARRHTNGMAEVVNAFADSVDPAETQQLMNNSLSALPEWQRDLSDDPRLQVNKKKCKSQEFFVLNSQSFWIFVLSLDNLAYFALF
jgi:hypothetical protein